MTLHKNISRQVIQAMAKSVSLLLLFTLFQPVFGQPATDPELKRFLEPLLQQHRGDVGLAIKGLDSGVHYEFNADVPMPTASLIKLPILVTAYRQMQQGRLELWLVKKEMGDSTSRVAHEQDLNSSPRTYYLSIFKLYHYERKNQNFYLLIVGD